jgi:hypothetical protein
MSSNYQNLLDLINKKLYWLNKILEISNIFLLEIIIIIFLEVNFLLC